MANEVVRIERAVYGGDGLARAASGQVAFVPYTLAGELVEIAPPTTGSESDLLRVLETSAERTTARCRHFGVCGGCQYQHANYDEQLRIKQEILLETMQRAGLRDLPELGVVSGEAWEYRNRVRFRLHEVEGGLRVGYSMRASNQFLPIAECPISAPLLLRAAFLLLEVAGQHRDARAWLASASEAEFFSNERSTALTMTITMVTSRGLPRNGFAVLCEALRTKVPELTGAGAVLAKSTGPARDQLESWRAAGLPYRAADETYWISRGGFFQTNRFLIDRLIALVCDDRSGTLAWDLFAGVGLFSRVLARSFAQVIAVEANPSAVADLVPALKKLSPRHRAEQASTLNFLRNAAVQRERPDLIVLDPPRAGAGAEVCELLLRLAPAEMVYVSCDPTTLARDLAVLEQGYLIDAFHLVDLFPQTFHMESVVVLKRR